MIRVAIVDDHKIVMEGVRYCFEENEEFAGMELVYSTTEPKLLLEYVQTKKNIDVLLLDISMPGLNGIQLIQVLKAFDLNIRCLMYTTYTEEKLIESAIVAGACGFVGKNSSFSELKEAIEVVFRLGFHFSKEIPKKMVSKLLSNEIIKPAFDLTAVLSKREQEIAILIGKGLALNEIADKLFISKRTVDSHKRSLCKKIGVTKPAEISHYCIFRGWTS